MVLKLTIATVLAILVMWGALLLMPTGTFGWPDLIYIRLLSKTYYFRPWSIFTIWGVCVIGLITALLNLFK